MSERKRDKIPASRPTDPKAAKKKRRREKIGATRPKLITPEMRSQQRQQQLLEEKKTAKKVRPKKPPGPKIKMSVCDLRILARDNKIKITTLGAKGRTRYKTRIELFMELKALGLPVN